MNKHTTGALSLCLLTLTLVACDDSGSEGSDAEVVSDTAAPDVAADTVADVGPDVAADATPDATPTSLEFPVDADGPFGVGYQTWDITYLGVTGEERTIPLQVWYPTDATTGKHPSFFPPDEQSLIDAPAADPVDGTSYPVLVHSHGHQAFGGHNHFLMRRMATHGWVALSVDHVGDLFGDTNPGSTVVHWLERPGDISAALDAIAALDPANPLSRAETDRVVLSGHSRGVYTVWALAGAVYDMALVAANKPDATEAELAAFATGTGDARVVAAIPMAGTYSTSWFGEEGWQFVDIPMMSLSGDMDNPTANQDRFDRVDGLDFSWVELAGGCHETFGLGFCDSMEPETGFHIVETYTLAFGRLQLLGDLSANTRGILDGSVEVSPLATLKVR